MSVGGWGDPPSLHPSLVHVICYLLVHVNLKVCMWLSLYSPHQTGFGVTSVRHCSPSTAALGSHSTHGGAFWRGGGRTSRAPCTCLARIGTEAAFSESLGWRVKGVPIGGHTRTQQLFLPSQLFSYNPSGVQDSKPRTPPQVMAGSTCCSSPDPEQQQGPHSPISFPLWGLDAARAIVAIGLRWDNENGKPRGQMVGREDNAMFAAQVAWAHTNAPRHTPTN